MAGIYILKHPTTAAGANGTAGGPWLYFNVVKVSYAHANNLLKAQRPNTDVRMRRRAVRTRTLNIIGTLVADEENPRQLGVQTSAAAPTGTGKDMQETLEDAAATWKTSGAIRLQIGTKADGSAKFFDGLIDGVTIDWEPDKAEDEAPVRRFTMQFTIGTVGS